MSEDYSPLGALAAQQLGALEDDLSSRGVTLIQLSKSGKQKELRVHLDEQKLGLFVDPPIKKQHSILFADIVHIVEIDENSKAHQALKVKKFQYCFQIALRTGLDVTFVVSTRIDRSTWLRLFTKYQLLEASGSYSFDPFDAMIDFYWAKANRTRDERLSFHDIVSLVIRIVGHRDQSEIAIRFKQFDRDNNMFLDFAEFERFIRPWIIHNEFQQIYSSLCSDPTSGMNINEFARFLAVQRTTGDVNVKELFDFLCGKQSALTYEIFSAFLIDPVHNSIVDPSEQSCKEELGKHPLTSYYIMSSHNTYLTGDQLRSRSSTNQYRDVLLSGCRCVEIDCWDGPGGQPIVYHGHTATTKILFEDVIKVVNEYAFQVPINVSPAARQMPVILSLEVHTSDVQCNTMATIMQTIFGDKLLLPGECKEFTPHNLKGKILVKWKSDAGGDDDVKDVEGSGIRPNRRLSSPHICASLCECTTIGSIKTSSWGDDGRVYNVQSYSENQINSIRRNNNSMRFVTQNTKMLSRVYPAGSRVTSTNYDPMQCWRLGCHMVALNFQTRDLEMCVNEGFFLHQNGGCGYVLKPPLLRDPAGGTLEGAPFTLQLTIASGSQLSEAAATVGSIDSYVKVWIYGEREEGRETRVVEGDAAHPLWNETYTFNGTYFDLDVLCFRVMGIDENRNHREIATAFIPVKVLRRGYRAVPLNHPKSGERFRFASLICSAVIQK